jgi:hypothetical protein
MPKGIKASQGKEIRNPKLEIRNKAPNSKQIQNPKRDLDFGFPFFEFVSNLGFRISDLRVRFWFLGFGIWFFRFRRFLAGEKDIANLDGGIGLAMASQPAVILAPAEMLHVDLGGRVLDDFTDNSGALNNRLADVNRLALRVKQDPLKLEASARLGFAIIDSDLVPFAHLVLTGTVFKNRVHDYDPVSEHLVER